MEIVASGALGRIVAVMGSAVFYKPDDYYDDAHAWRRRPGGGPILINMIHEIGNLRAMVGEIDAVQAFSSNAIRKFAVEDTVAINLRFANGALGTFLLSDTAASPKSWEQTSQENNAYASDADEGAYVILGTNGSLSVPTMCLRFYAKAGERSWFKPFQSHTYKLDRADPLALQIEHFADVIRGAAAPRRARRAAEPARHGKRSWRRPGPASRSSSISIEMWDSRGDSTAAWGWRLQRDPYRASAMCRAMTRRSTQRRQVIA